ncbi:MAG TPA: autotransporter assembly complex family protein [Burkholderiaceae bacterium]|nr:autotransporter assembly complex family protein [Burkholderiaceae bacterium]
MANFKRGIVASAWRAIVMVIWLACAPIAFAETRYTVEIDTEVDRARELLEKHLELMRRREDPEVDREQLDILVDRAVRQARTLFATEGFFEPEVQASIDDSERPWRVRLTVAAGRPVRVRNIDFALVGAGAEAGERLYEARRLDEQWRIVAGRRFRQEDWDATKTALLRELRAQLFPDARIAQSRVEVKPDARVADVTLHIEPGDPRYFGDISVTGLQRYTPNTVLNLNQEVVPGGPFEQSRLLDFQSRVQTTPYFKDVIVTPAFEEVDDQGRVPIIVRVNEQPTKTVTLGAGYSTNTGLRSQFGFDHYDIFDRSWRWTNLLKLEQREQSFESAIALPTNAKRYDDSLRTVFKHSDIEDLDTRSAELNLRRARTEREYQRAFGVRYLFSQERPKGGDERIARALIPYVTWTRRRLDDFTYPRQGDLLNLQLSGASNAVLSDATYVRTYARYLRLFPVGERDVLSARAEAGYVAAESRFGIPQDELFRAGGDASIRGYSYQSIGVKEGTATVGGRYLALAGLEYTHWFRGAFGMGVFVDTGDAFDDRREFKLYTGYGLGPRWRSPVGPINIDLAYGDRAQTFRVHFSLGLVF